MNYDNTYNIMKPHIQNSWSLKFISRPDYTESIYLKSNIK